MPAGRPSEFRPEYIAQAQIMCSAGATDSDLAEEFGVTTQTVRNWRLRYPEFFAAIKLSKDVADQEVERSLYARAKGYTFNSEKIFCKDGQVTRVACVEHVPPDPTSMIFWLKNRKPAEWRDKHDIEHSGGLQLLTDIPRATEGS